MKKEKIFRKFYLLLIGIFIIGAMFTDNNVQAMNKKF